MKKKVAKKAPAKKKPAVKKAVIKKPATSKPAAEVSKSQAIRDFFKVNPKATGKEVVEGLKKDGIVVSLGLIGNVKAKAGLSKKRSKSKSRVAPVRVAKVPDSQTISISALREAKKLLGEAGSVDAAIQAIKVLDGLS